VANPLMRPFFFEFIESKVLFLPPVSIRERLNCNKFVKNQNFAYFCREPMRLTNKKALEKLKRKNRGNAPLANAIATLVGDIEGNDWKNQAELKEKRPEADCVHSDGFYFFNLVIHRILVLIEFEDGEASVVWLGNHKEYETTFKNNKNTIKKWLKFNNWI
jgi:mRNA-degrading endonuclease HigB of HigAB toxin-antitoxin module